MDKVFTGDDGIGVYVVSEGPDATFDLCIFDHGRSPISSRGSTIFPTTAAAATE